MNASIIWNELRKELSEAGTAAVMGNLFMESSLKANNLENTGNTVLGVSDSEYTALVDSLEYDFSNDGYGYGLAQWTYHTRKQALQNFALERGESIGNVSMQCKFLLTELGGYPSLKLALMNGTFDELENLTKRVMVEYERPANVGEVALGNRVFYATKYYHTFTPNSVLSESEAETGNDNTFTVGELRTALEVINGKFGVYPERKTLVEKKGHQYERIQALVNLILEVQE